MNTQIIYDVANEPPITPFSIPVIIICLLSIIFIVYLIKIWKNSDSVVGNIILLVVAVFVLSITVTTHSVNFFKVKKYFRIMKKGIAKLSKDKLKTTSNSIKWEQWRKRIIRTDSLSEIQNLLFTAILHTVSNIFGVSPTAVNCRKDKT